MGNSSSSSHGTSTLNRVRDGGIGGSVGGGVGGEGRGSDGGSSNSGGPGIHGTGGTGGNGGSGGGSRSRAVPSVHLPLSSLPSPFRSGNGSLGLSRAELDARCQPSGLYPTCEWEAKTIRRLIGDGKLAARLKGSDSRLTKTDRECPICFMYYSENNITKCCNATICTECYLQIKPPTPSSSHSFHSSRNNKNNSKPTTCPFCNCGKLTVTVQKGMDEDAVAKREEEEQKVIEATIRRRAEELNGEGPGTPLGDSLNAMQRSETDPLSDGGTASSHSGFGSSLENYNRARTFSSASSNGGSNIESSDHDGTSTPVRPSRPEGNGDALLSLAMSPEERRALEREMRAQQSHPTHQRMEHEAEEARMRHAQEWYNSESGVRSRIREARMAELTRLLARMSGDVPNDADGNDANNERRGSRNGEDGGTGEGGGGGDNDPYGLFGLGGLGGMGTNTRNGGGRELTALLRALEASSRATARAAAGGGRGGMGSLEDLMRLENAFFMDVEDSMRPQRGPQWRTIGRGRNSDNDNEGDEAGANGRTRASQRRSSGNTSNTSSGNNTEDGDRTPNTMNLGAPSLRLPRSGASLLGTTRSNHTSRRMGRGLVGQRGVSSTHMDTAELLMRGISEDEQLAMAIALSLRESNEQQGGENIGVGGAGNGGDGGQEGQNGGEAHVEGATGTSQNESSNTNEDDDSDSSSDSSSSDSSSDGDHVLGAQGQTTPSQTAVANIDQRVSLDDDEEEVVFMADSS